MRTSHRILTAAAAVMATIVPAAAANAAPVTVVRSGFISAFVSTCTHTEETIFVTGRYQEVVRFNPDGSFSSGNNTIKATGTGDQGNVYTVMFNGHDRFDAGGTEQFKGRELLISKGSAPNQLVDYTLTIPPVGDAIFTMDTVCTG